MNDLSAWAQKHVMDILPIPAEDFIYRWGRAAAQFKYDGVLKVAFKTPTRLVFATKHNGVTDVDPSTVNMRPGIYLCEEFSPWGDVYKQLRHDVPHQRVYYDILYDGREPVTDRTYKERLALLMNRITDTAEDFVIKTRWIGTREEAQAEFDRALQLGYEGLVLKADEPYGTRDSMAKWKPYFDQDTIVTGYAKNEAWARTGLATSFNVAVWEDGKLRDMGSAGSGLNWDEREALTAELARFRTGEDEHFIFVQPRVCVELKYQSLINPDNPTAFRFPVIRRWRLDKIPQECVLTGKRKA